MKRTREEREEVEEVEEEDGDEEFLEQVLNTLYDFGDKAKGKKSKKRHKKGTKTIDDYEEEVAEQEEPSHDKISGDGDNRDCPTTEENVSGRSGSQIKGQATKTSTVEIVTFQDPRKKNKLKKAEEPETKPPEDKNKMKKDPDKVLSIEKTRLEVHRFGITGFQKQQQRVFEQDRAIMLGARPPKKEYMNYKVYQQMIKEKKFKEKEDKPDTPRQKKKKSGKQKSEKRKPAPSGGESTGQVGRFKNGMLVLSSKDIQKLNSKVRK